MPRAKSEQSTSPARISLFRKIRSLLTRLRIRMLPRGLLPLLLPAVFVIPITLFTLWQMWSLEHGPHSHLVDLSGAAPYGDVRVVGTLTPLPSGSFPNSLRFNLTYVDLSA